MDRQSLGFGNDSVQNDSVLSECTHGQPWDSCHEADCQEIWQLYQQALLEERREEADRVYAQRARKRRGKKKSEFEIALETTGASNAEDNETSVADEEANPEPEPPRARKLFREIFPDEITLRAAVQFRAVTLRQGELLEAYLESDDGLPDYKRWDAIGRKIACSGRTVEREFQKLVEKFFVEKSKSESAAAGAIELVHVRGERKPRYYRRHTVQFGEWKRNWSELITDRKTIRDLRRRRVPMIQSNKIPIPSSPVNWLFGELIRVFGNAVPNPERLPSEGISASDWEYNIRRARRLLAGKKHLTGPWTPLEVAKKLVRGGRLCRGCRTYLIRGFRINGRRITRAREFCDEACKMRAERRKNRTTTG